MRSFVMLTLGLLAIGRVAHAQSAASKGYVEGVAQSAFGNVTSQSYGAEGGFALTPGLWIFVEGGQIRDVATAAIGTAAQQIAASLTDVQPAAVAYRVQEPVTFGAVGLKYEMVASGKAHPYLMVGGGMARVPPGTGPSLSDTRSSVASPVAAPRSTNHEPREDWHVPSFFRAHHRGLCPL